MRQKGKRVERFTRVSTVNMQMLKIRKREKKQKDKMKREGRPRDSLTGVEGRSM